MKLSAPHAFANPFLVGLLVTLGFGGSVGVGTVWMRHQVSVLADTNRDLEQQYRDVEREVADVSAQVESQLSPDILRAEDASMKLGLVEMTQAQIDTVTIDPIARLAARANRRVFEGEAAGADMEMPFNVPDAVGAPAPRSGGVVTDGRQPGEVRVARNP